MENEELDLKELFMVFWNKKFVIFVITLLFAILGAVYTFYLVEPFYTSSTTLILVTDKTNVEKERISDLESELSVNSKLVSTYSELIKSKAVLRQVVDDLAYIDLSEGSLRGNVTVSSVKDTELIKIQVKNDNPEDAADIANDIAKVFSEKVKDIYKMDNVYVVDKAEVPNSPSNENHKKNIIIFALAGLVISAGVVLLENFLDTTVKDPEALERELKIPVLASIPFNIDR